MRSLLLVAILLALLQQAIAIPYSITLDNVSVQTDIQALRNGFHEEITQHGDGLLPSFSIPLDVACTSPSLEIYPGPMPTLEEIRHLLGQDVAASDLLDLQTGLWPVNDGQVDMCCMTHRMPWERGSCLARPACEQA